MYRTSRATKSFHRHGYQISVAKVRELNVKNNCVIIGHALSFTQLFSRRPPAETIGFKLWQTKKESWLFTERGLGFETRITVLGRRDSNLKPLGLGVQRSDHSNTLPNLRDVSLIVPQPIRACGLHFNTRCLSGTSNNLAPVRPL